MSNKKFFNLLYGDQIRVAPETKVIPADEVSALVSGQEVVNKVQEEARRYRKEVATECEELKEAAEQQGFEAGFAKWAEYVALLEEEIAATKRRIQEIAVPLALKAARKIVGHQIEVDPQVTIDIVTNNLKAVATHKQIIIWCSKQDLQLLEKHKEQLKAIFEELESLSIRERDDIEGSSCVIETEGGIINAQLSTKWEALERAFQALLADTTTADEHHMPAESDANTEEEQGEEE